MVLNYGIWWITPAKFSSFGRIYMSLYFTTSIFITWRTFMSLYFAVFFRFSFSDLRLNTAITGKYMINIAAKNNSGFVLEPGISSSRPCNISKNLIERETDWLVGWLIGWWVEWLIDWLILLVPVLPASPETEIDGGGKTSSDVYPSGGWRWKIPRGQA